MKSTISGSKYRDKTKVEETSEFAAIVLSSRSELNHKYTYAESNMMIS